MQLIHSDIFEAAYFSPYWWNPYITFFRHIQPICLPLGSNLKRDYVGTLPVALGWGTTYYGGEEVAKLRSVPLPVWTNGDCDDAYFQPITGMIRA